MSAIDFQALLRKEKAKARRTFARRKRGSVKKTIEFSEKSSSTDAPGKSFDSTPDKKKPQNDARKTENSKFDETSIKSIILKKSRNWAALRDECLVSDAGIWYIQDFVSCEDEKVLLSEIYAADECQWVNLKNRRLQSWGKMPDKQGLKQQALPKWLSQLIGQLESFGLFFNGNAGSPQDKGAESCRPNHVLINEYKPGQGIMAHKDGPAYKPLVAILSLGSSSIFHFYESLQDARKEKALIELFLEARSLLVFSRKAYETLYHGIPERKHDIVPTKPKCLFTGATVLRPDGSVGVRPGDAIARGTRVSLTMREAIEPH